MDRCTTERRARATDTDVYDPDHCGVKPPERTRYTHASDQDPFASERHHDGQAAGVHQC